MATIFLIDDDFSIVTLFDKFLTILGHQIVAKAYNGEEAVSLFKQFREIPDLVLMDHRMPKKDGLTAAKEILTTNDKTKIIFFKPIIGLYRFFVCFSFAILQKLCS